MSQIHAGAVLYAKDYLRIADFYRQVTDIEICETDKTHVKLESESFQLVVLQTPEHLAKAIEISEPPSRRENTPIKLVFYVASINEAREIAKELGGELNASMKEWEFGEYRVCDGHDPEGNIFQLRAPER